MLWFPNHQFDLVKFCRRNDERKVIFNCFLRGSRIDSFLEASVDGVAVLLQFT